MNEAIINGLLDAMPAIVLAEVEHLRTSPDFPRERLTPDTCDMGLASRCLYGQAFGNAYNPPAIVLKRNFRAFEGLRLSSALESYAFNFPTHLSFALCAYIKGE